MLIATETEAATKASAASRAPTTPEGAYPASSSTATVAHTPSPQMASHVPFLAVRPDDQFSAEVKTRDWAVTNGVPAEAEAAAAAMDGTEAPFLPVPHASRLPSWIRLPLVTVLSLAISAGAYTVVADYTGLEMASVSRDLHDEWQVAAVLGWKIVSLAAAWISGYDCELAMHLASHCTGRRC